MLDIGGEEAYLFDAVVCLLLRLMCDGGRSRLVMASRRSITSNKMKQLLLLKLEPYIRAVVCTLELSYCIAAINAAVVSTFERLIAHRAEHSVPHPPPSQRGPINDLFVAEWSRQ